jgi:Peptidase family S41/Tricorn protease C1 domain
MQLRMIRTVLQLIACVAVTAAASSAQESLDGFWESEGFGYVFAISGRSLKAFEVTATTCVASFTAQRLPNSQPGRAATFRSKEDVFFVRQGGTDDSMLLHQEDTIADITIHRIGHSPASCDRPTPDTPEGNFEVFAQTWAENYISFERRGVDWSRVVAEHRQRINARTTPGELFSVLQAMIEQFADMHTYLSAPSLKQSTKQFWRPGTDRVVKGGIEEFDKRGRRKFFSFIDHTNLRHEAKMFCNRGLHYGDLGGGVGYLRIRSFGAYSKSNDGEALEGCLDTIFGGGKIQSLVIDMRLAFGGSDELGLAIARRFAAEPYLAYAVQVRSRSIEGWTAKQPVVVQPSPRPGFRGPIAVLTGPVTLSAAESFVLALIGRNPPVVRIGENTQGVFCDVLSRRLPNGWTFGLPNAVYSTIDGKTFDVTGIPPDIPVPVFADADLEARRDPAIETARRVLSKIQ